MTLIQYDLILWHQECIGDENAIIICFNGFQQAREVGAQSLVAICVHQ